MSNQPTVHHGSLLKGAKAKLGSNPGYGPNGNGSGALVSQVDAVSLAAAVEKPQGQTGSPIWAIGGGKGGTGKTFFTAALAQQMSRSGISVNLVDADFGGPNLHTFLGVRQANRDLSDFFFQPRKPLEDVFVETGLSGIRLAAGSNGRFNMANIEYFRKLKLLRHIRALEGHTIIDTGAGSAFNSIEFFNSADIPILLINPNPASMENMFLFLEATALRILKLEVRLLGMQQVLKDYWVSSGKPPESVPAFLEFSRAMGSAYEERFQAALERFQPCLIVNKIRAEDDALLGRCVVDVGKRCLSTRIHYLGAIPHDERITDSLMGFSPFVSAHPSSEAAIAIMIIMDRLLEHSASPERAQ